MSAVNIGMPETPDQRRERIDAARRTQVELGRQIGHELNTLAIKPSAAAPWQQLNADLARADHRGEKGARCIGKEDIYQDYDAFNVPSPGKAKMMCAGCPQSTELGGSCGTFAEADRPGWGVWDGRVYGHKLAEIERKEAIKAEKAKSTKEDA